MLELFSLLFLVSESTHDAVVSSPEVLDLGQIQRWLSGSVWALVGLNIIALLLFLGAISAPQLRKLQALASGIWMSIKEKRAQKKAAVAPAAEPPPVVETPPPEVAAPEPELPAIDEIPPVTKPVEIEPKTEKILAPKDPEEDFLPPPPEPLPEFSKPAFSDPDKTEILLKEEMPSQAAVPPPVESPLPSRTPFGETTETMEAPDFDKTISDILAETPDAPEEVPIFDSKALEDSLKKAVEELEASEGSKSGG